MRVDLSDHGALYQALVERDVSYDGRAYVCVTSTGVFCRLSCPARKPRAENCLFFASAQECSERGYRPCKRCKPLVSSVGSEPTVDALLAALEADPSRRWREADLQDMGFDPSTVRRAFKRQFGMTFLEMSRQRRLRDGFQAIEGGGKVIDAQIRAGFESSSAFRSAFARLLGIAPGKLSPKALLYADWIPTQLGDMVAICDSTKVHLLEFIDRKALPTELAKLYKWSGSKIGVGKTKPSRQVAAELLDFFEGRCSSFRTPIVEHGSGFTKSVWKALRRIPVGETRSYSEIAKAIGRPSAVRAVARANASNQIAVLIPCHRVIGADGSLVGYGGGLWRKQKLLEIERRYLEDE